MNDKKYNVTIKEIKGTCDSNLFKKMLTNGDITSYKVKDCVGDIIKITGYAYAEIETNDKKFNIGYYATDKGFYSTGSEVFLNSVKDYFNECEKYIIMEVRTKKGNTYKASPVLDFKIDEDTGVIE